MYRIVGYFLASIGIAGILILAITTVALCVSHRRRYSQPPVYAIPARQFTDRLAYYRAKEEIAKGAEVMERRKATGISMPEVTVSTQPI